MCVCASTKWARDIFLSDLHSNSFEAKTTEPMTMLASLTCVCICTQNKRRMREAATATAAVAINDDAWLAVWRYAFVIVIVVISIAVATMRAVNRPTNQPVRGGWLTSLFSYLFSKFIDFRENYILKCDLWRNESKCDR